jgi:hypothetical protein
MRQRRQRDVPRRRLCDDPLRQTLTCFGASDVDDPKGVNA